MDSPEVNKVIAVVMVAGIMFFVTGCPTASPTPRR
jgi:hypothetical protein